MLGIVGPSGCGKSTLLELIGGLREPGGGEIAVGGSSAGADRLAGCAHMPQRDLLLPWLTRDRQRRDRAAQPRRLEARRRASSPSRCSSASASPGSSRPAPASCPAGCASASPSCARCLPTSPCCCSTSRSPRSTRSPAPRCRSGSRRRSPRSPRRRSSSPTTSRRRSTSAIASRCCRRARDGSSAILRSPSPRHVPRLETVTSPEFGDRARARARAALRRRWTR